MSNEAPETEREVMVALVGRTDDPERRYLQLSSLAPRVLEMLTTAREQGRAEALADVTEGDVDAFEHGWHGALGDWRSVVKTGINHFLASRRRPVAAAGNEEWDASGD